MKSLKLIFIGIAVPGLWLLSAAIVNAQTEGTVEPAQLTVAGLRGAVESRQIFVRTTNPIKNFQVSSLDLNRTDGIAVLPAAAILPQKTLINQNKPNELTVPVKFDLQKVPSSGEFNGKLRLSYQDGELTVPVTVRVKDHWLLPLIVLLIGTGLGVGVSIYRAQGRPRDEMLVRVSQLRVQMQDDKDLTKAEAFQSRVEAQLVDVRMALQGERWEEAQNAVKQAEMIWSKWTKGRTDWLAQLAYRDELNERLQDMNPSIPYVQTVRRHLEDAVREAPELDSPRQLRDRLEELAQQLNRYIQLQTKLKQLNNLLTQLPADQAALWQSKVQSWERQMDSLQPSDLTKETNLQTEVEGAIPEITQLVLQQEGTGATAKGLPKLGLTMPLLAPAPSVSSLTWEERASGASQRLKAFTLGSYVIAVVFLAGAGFSQLYVDQPTFGANPSKDYFALLAWGFGAEATRDAVTKVVQGWGLPGLK
jgi:hypothetical protein